MAINRGLFEAQNANKSFTKTDLQQFSEVQRWLESQKESTKHVYLQALISFTDFTKLNPKELIDLAEEDQKKSQRERGEPARKILAFYKWLTTEYVRKERGNGTKNIQSKKQLSRNLACTYSQAIKGFFKQNGFSLSVKMAKPVGKKENFNPAPPRIPEVKRLMDAITCLLDRCNNKKRDVWLTSNRQKS